jgi:hypothetical protein
MTGRQNPSGQDGSRSPDGFASGFFPLSSLYGNAGFSQFAANAFLPLKKEENERKALWGYGCRLAAKADVTK